MGFFQAFIHRPIMATALNLVLLVIGLVVFNQLELRHFPNNIRNEFTIKTHYHGANSLAVEQKVTKVLEDTLSGLEGIQELSSDSSDEMSEIYVKFKPSISHQVALNELRDRIFSAMSALPDHVKRPKIQERRSHSRSLMDMAFSDEHRSTAALSDYIRRNVEDRLRLVEGVASVEIWGDRIYQVSILLDPALLMEHQMTASDVVRAVQHETPFASAGEIEKETGKKSVVLSVSANTPAEYGEIVVKNTAKGGRIRVKDVAQVKITERLPDYQVRLAGKSMVGLSITAKPQANPLQVAQKLRAFVESMQASLPQGMQAHVYYDSSEALESSITSIQQALWEAIILVGIIVSLSLGSVRAALFPMITIPLCLVGSFILLWCLGFSVNPITLLALVLAVGLVVDDAIVVVENIHRQMEEGLSAFEASKKAMKEITFAVIVMTITLAAVYVPLAFQQNESAAMFKEFAWTLAGAVLISGFVALTLTPALCGQFLQRTERKLTWDTLTRRYTESLEKAFKNPKRMLGLALLIACLGVVGFLQLPSELAPAEDESWVHGYIDASNAVPEAIRNGWFQEIETVLQSIPGGLLATTAGIDPCCLSWSLLLKPCDLRNQSQAKIEAELQAKLSRILGPKVGVEISEGTGFEDEPLKIKFQYTAPYQAIVKLIKAVLAEAQTLPEFQRVFSEETRETTRIKVTVDRPLAQEMGVDPEEIEETLYTLLSGRKASVFNFQGFDYDVRVQAALSARSDANHLNQFFVKGSEEQWIPLGSLLSIQEEYEPQTLKHYERMRGAAITVIPKPGVSIEQAMQKLEPIIQKHLPSGASYAFAGKAEHYREAKTTSHITYVLSLVFIYLVLSALFESFIHPFLVLLTVPLSAAGAIWGIHLLGGSHNIYTSIGLVTLMGLITKHGILILDFANRLRNQGLSIRQAIVKAASIRLRPVLMTTLAMVMAAVPLLFSMGAYANARIHIGVVIIAGMLSGTFFSLYIVPLAYQILLESSWSSLRSTLRARLNIFVLVGRKFFRPNPA